MRWPFAARQRRGAAPEREIPHADVVQESKPIADLAQDPAGDERLALAEIERVEHAERIADRQVDVLGDRSPLHPDRPALRLQPLAGAGRARPKRPVRLERFLLEPRALLVAPPQIRDDTLEAGAVRIVVPRPPACASVRPPACPRPRLRRPGPIEEISRCFFGSLQNGVSRSIPKFRPIATSASRTSFLSPRAQGASAPSTSDSPRPARSARDRSRRRRRGPGSPGTRRGAS